MPQNSLSLALIQVFGFALLFSLIGDSNVRRNMTPFNCHDRPAQLSAETKICGKIDIFAETLRSTMAESTAVIISCLTNFIAESEGSSNSVSMRIQPVLLQACDVLLDFCDEQPDRLWLVAPPMYCTSPVWLLDGMPEVMLKFS